MMTQAIQFTFILEKHMRLLSYLCLIGLILLPLVGCGPPSASGTPSISEEEFQKEVLDSEVPVLLDFSAEWCGPCKAVSPILHEIEGETTGRMKLYVIDVDQNAFWADQFGVSAIPELVLMNNGQRITTYSGDLSESSVRHWVESSLKLIEEEEAAESNEAAADDADAVEDVEETENAADPSDPVEAA